MRQSGKARRSEREGSKKRSQGVRGLSGLQATGGDVSSSPPSPRNLVRAARYGRNMDQGISRERRALSAVGAGGSRWAAS